MERLLLGLCTGICRIAVGVETALVTDADTVCIEMAGVGTDFCLGWSGVDDAVFRDVIVITDAAETAG